MSDGQEIQVDDVLAEAAEEYDGVKVTDDGMLTMEARIPESKIRELVEDWREGYDVYKRATDPETDIRANVLEQCANDLEALIDDE